MDTSIYNERIFDQAFEFKKQEREKLEQENKEIKRKNTENALYNAILRRGELMGKIPHHCKKDFCNPRNCSSFYTSQQCLAFDSAIYMCIYGFVHECRDCVGTYDEHMKYVCEVTHVELQE